MKLALNPSLEHSFPVEHQSQFATRQTIEVGYFELTDKRGAIILCQVAFNLQTSQRIGSVKYDKLFPVLSSCLHGQPHGADVGE